MDYSIPPPTQLQKKNKHVKNAKKLTKIETIRQKGIFTDQPSMHIDLVNSAVLKALKQFPGKALDLIDLVTSSKPP